MPRTAKARKGESGTKATKPPNRPAPPTKDQIRAIADEAARIADDVEMVGATPRVRTIVSRLRKGLLKEVLNLAYDCEGELVELAPTGRGWNTGPGPDNCSRVTVTVRGEGEIDSAMGVVRDGLSKVSVHLMRISTGAPTQEVVSGLRAAAAGLRRWAGPDGKGSGSAADCKARSRPMSKSRMMKVLGIDSPKTFNAWASDKDLRPAGNRQTWTICMDVLDPQTKSKLEK